jgi:hypothetical protein
MASTSSLFPTWRSVAIATGAASPRDLAERSERLLAYQVVLAEGSPQDIQQVVDGALLVDCWGELHLPAEIRQAWQPLVDRARRRVAR